MKTPTERLLVLKRISALVDNDYELVFERIDGSEVTARCTMSAEGNYLERIDPDVFNLGDAHPQDVAPIVGLMHRARTNAQALIAERKQSGA